MVRNGLGLFLGQEGGDVGRGMRSKGHCGPVIGAPVAGEGGGGEEGNGLECSCGPAEGNNLIKIMLE